MRSIINISIPSELAERVKLVAKSRNFKSLSEYFVYSVELEQSLISEDEVLALSEHAQNAYDSGNTSV
jgi:hypothetical protein